MRVIARKTLKRFLDSLQGNKDHKAVKSALDAWFHEARQADWHSPTDVVKAYANASIVGSDQVVFNIKGNDYRLIAVIHYNRNKLYVRHVLTHAEYDLDKWKEG